MRHLFYKISAVVFGFITLATCIWGPSFLWTLVLIAPIFGIGVADVFNKKQTIKANFPVIGRFRYFFELIRPEIQQYFIESNSDGAPFSREERSVVYQRSKKVRDTVPFGTQLDVYAPGYEWLNHSMAPKVIKHMNMRVTIGGPRCLKPYSASLLNIGAMSFGALSDRAVLSLNGGAKDAHFAHNTGEGSISPYHLQNGGDLVWQIGTGYFGCRNLDGTFNAELFSHKATLDSVKMIEIKLSQGAKPGHGGILPANKVTKEIAAIRHAPLGQDLLSPPRHSAFSTPIEFMHFIQNLRDLSGGKPVGFKLCLGKRREFLALCKAMLETGIYPDFITVDGGEGGTGAAPLEFSNYIGSPLVESVIFIHNSLVGFNLRPHIKIIATGKVISAFALIKRLAIGADLCYSARGMLLALGCIQALRCNSNECPTGITTHDRQLVKGLNVIDKRNRVANFHRQTMHTVAELIGAMGLDDTTQLKPWHLMRRINQTEILHYGEIYEYIKPGSLLTNEPPKSFKRALAAASAHSFDSETSE